MSVRLRGKRHEASDTTSFDRIYFPPGSIGFWRESIDPNSRRRRMRPIPRTSGVGRVSCGSWLRGSVELSMYGL